ncbi:MAG: ABC transporter permease [Segniliparus sp.]|uniref:ABC transporter permease n=1 Tax=Segniliparus sp. TaxID=2804064 RepID=UPI003F33BC6F
MTSSTLVAIGPQLAVALVLLVLFAMGASALGQLGHARGILAAALRAAAQLGALAVVLAALVAHGALVFAFLAVMSLAAAYTAARRIRPTAQRRLQTVAVCLLPAVLPALLLVGTLVAAGIVPRQALAVVPVAGILAGNAMVATSLAGQRARDELRTRAGEVEAALALGFAPRDAALLICRPAAATSLGPAIDQAKTTGLVTIPGAFAGTLLAGASAWQAGVVQLFVLIGILAVQSVAVAATTWLIADGRL